LWLPPPFLPATIVLLFATRLGATGRWAWLLAGLAAGLWSLVWVPHAGLALLCAPLTLAGSALGNRIAQIVERPAQRAVLVLTVLVAGVIPAFTGAIDLYLRHNTP
jgi:hypothetical protein